MKRYSGRLGVAVLAVAGALLAGTAQAEPGEFLGNFSFQSDDLEPGPDVQILSGYAITELQNNGAYRVALLATDFRQNTAGESRRVYALQLCTGQPSGTEMVITCQVSETTGTNYAPDNFRLRQDPDVPSLWRGTLITSRTTPVEFFDLD